MKLLRGTHRALLALCAISTAAVALASCTGSSAAPIAAIPTPARATIPSAGAAGSSAASAADLTRTNQAGNVTIEVTWQTSTASPGKSLLFKVVMDTHSVDLDSVDLAKLALLRNDGGKEVSPERWDAPAGGHHRSGTISFPAVDGDASLIGPQTKYIELVVRDVAGVKERNFKWEVTS